MNKQEYIKELKTALKGIDKTEALRTIEFYEELIDDALEDGKSEEETIAGLEQPSVVLARLKGEQSINEKKMGRSIVFIIAVVLASPIWLPIVVSVMAVVFSVYVSLWAIVFSLIASAAGTVVGAVCGIAAAVMRYPDHGIADSLFVFGSSLAAAGVAIYLMYLSCIAAKYYFRFSSSCVMSIRRMVEKRRKAK